MSAPTVVLAVSGHGFGHAVRSAEVALQLVRRGARVLVRTDAPAWLFPGEVEYLPSPGWPLDIGVAQHDGLDLDIDATRRQWHARGKRAARRHRPRSRPPAARKTPIKSVQTNSETGAGT